MSEDIFSPNGQYKVSFSSYEIRMSHWIDQPFLIRVSDNVCLFTLNTDVWSAWKVNWLDESTVELFVRKYPGQIACTVMLNVSTNQAKAMSQSDTFSSTFPAVRDWILKLT